MSPRQAVAPPTYKSGWCGTAQHDRCRGAYAGAPCACRCHDNPPPPAVCGECGRPLEEAAPWPKH